MQASRYNFFVRSFQEDTVIAYNSLTGACFTLEEGEYRRASEILDALEQDGPTLDPLFQTLLAHGFIVSSHDGEREVIRRRYAEGRDQRRGLLLTLAPTISCNFGCSYCFQEHPRKRMTKENVAALERYVEERLAPETSLDVTWFGGEPLLAFETVVELNDRFVALCETRRCRFVQSMITNGSLLDPDKADALASYGNVRAVQITLDGPPDVHDRRRATAGKGKTFDRILHNVEHAAGKLPLSIRVNVDRSNYDRLDDLLQILLERGLRDQVSVYIAHVLPYTDVCADVESVALTKEEFARLEAQFAFRLLQLGFSTSIRLPEPRSGPLCTADDPTGAVVAPGDLVFRCWNEVAMPAAAASDSLGAPQDGSRMKGNRERWQSYDPFAHAECQECKVQPLCNGGCPWEARKNPTWSTGHCTPLRFNLADKLRLFHLQTAIRSSCGTAVGAEAGM